MYLRSEWQGEDEEFVSTLRHVRKLAKKSEHVTRAEAMADALKGGSGLLGLLDKERRAFEYVVRLTVWPHSMQSEHVDRLRVVGWSEPEISAINLVAACFAFMNTLADGTGVRLFEEKREFAIEMFGEQAWFDHEEWANGKMKDPKVSRDS